jgi:ribonuclease R
MKKQYIIETKDDTIPEEISITGSSYVVSPEIVAAKKMDELAKILEEKDE